MVARARPRSVGQPIGRRHRGERSAALALTGIPSGPYLVLPVLGPNNARDVTGDLSTLEDRSVVDLLRATHTFLNERIALHYGITDVKGDHFRRVDLQQSARWGLLGKGAVLMVTLLILAASGAGWTDFERISVYGDSVNDLALLERYQDKHPLVVKVNAELQDAQRHGVEITAGDGSEASVEELKERNIWVVACSI